MVDQQHNLPSRITKIWKRIRFCEPIVLVTVIVASGAAFIFLPLASELLEGETFALDKSILLSLRRTNDLSVPIGPAWLAHAVGDVTSLGGITVLSLITLIAATYLFLISRRPMAILTLVSVVGGWGLSTMAKILIGRDRPNVVPHLVNVGDLSFPSGHAMVSAATYLTLGALLSQLQTTRTARIYVLAMAVALTFIVGASRIYLGVHYPSDVLGGWCGGRPGR